MQFGLFYQLPCADSQAETVRYRETMEQITLADQLGFDCAWLAELHFFKPFSIMPSPLIVAAALAQHTQRIRLGIAVNLLPLYPPLRCAEDGATVDILSGGRLDFGVGRGAIPLHFSGFRIPREESRGRFEEALEIIRRAWTQERFSFKGRYYQVPEISVVPKPIQKPHPPIRIAANSPQTAAFAGREGYPIFVASVTNPLPKMREQVALYKQARAEGGHPFSARDLALLFVVFMGDGKKQAYRELEGSLTHYFRTVGRMVRLGERPREDDSYKYMRETQRRIEAFTPEEVERHVAILGSPGECLDKIYDLHQELGLGQLICWLNPGGLIPHRRVLALMERLATVVMPVLREL